MKTILIKWSVSEWRERLGHISIQSLKDIVSKELVSRVEFTDTDKFFCEGCVYGKHQSFPFPGRTYRNIKPDKDSNDVMILPESQKEGSQETVIDIREEVHSSARNEKLPNRFDNFELNYVGRDIPNTYKEAMQSDGLIISKNRSAIGKELNEIEVQFSVVEKGAFSFIGPVILREWSKNLNLKKENPLMVPADPNKNLLACNDNILQERKVRYRGTVGPLMFAAIATH
ncbi:hypothetical protein JTB14_004274 [Gonioctena quinquepunctata]|nr:hypothetical protein JTB14_004274 [Gonioctena quinquepunctata]